jgi:hypothetical protein
MYNLPQCRGGSTGRAPVSKTGIRGFESLTRAPVLFAALFLSACTSTVTVTCPAVTEWTPGQQLEAIEEIQQLPPGSILVEFLLDYSEMREKLRACQ